MFRPFLLLLSLVCSVSAEGSRPNFVFLLVDDLGFGDFGCYGAAFNETPHIDRLASEGMRFTNAYSACTVCSPSRAAILTGRYPARLHLTDWIAGHKKPFARLAVPEWKTQIDHERILLPEALKEAGYSTAFFGKWHLMPNGKPNFDEHYPTSHGFDINVGGREWGQPKGPGKYFSPFGMPNLDDGREGDFLTDKLTDAALEFLESTKRDQPFLLYFSYYTIHGPVMAPPDLVAKYQKKAREFENTKQEHLNPARAGMVEALDNSVGRVLAKLDELGIADHTLVILTGDNGGDYQGTTAGLRDFKGFSHEGGVRAPLLARWPGKIAQDSTSDELVMGTDFYPTMLDAAGLPPRDTEHLDGISIAPLLTGKTDDLERETLYWHYPHYHRTKPYGAIRKGELKLIEFLEDGAIELYDLDADPREKRNLARQHPDKAAALLQDLRSWRKEVGAQMPTPNPNHDPDKAGPNKRRKK
jgi:arylsulfatase A-like enzyme